jgi:hypothetical protein
MPEKNRGIGSEGLEQGGPDLGNNYSRPSSARNDTGARDAVIVPKDDQRNKANDDTLNMDSESSRNLTAGYKNEMDEDYDQDMESDVDEVENDDLEEDDVLEGLDDDDDEEDDEENDII